MIHTYGTNSAVENLDRRQWNTGESGRDEMRTEFMVKTGTAAQTLRTELINSGHPNYPGMRCLAKDVTIIERYALPRVSVMFVGLRGVTSLADSALSPGRVLISTAINPIQSEYVIRMLQNYAPVLQGPTAILLEEIKERSVGYPFVVNGISGAKNYLIYPVIESVAVDVIGSNIYDCTYYVTTRECMNFLTGGISMATGYTMQYATSGTSLFSDNSIYYSNLPTVRINMALLTLGSGLDRAALIAGKQIATGYTRSTDPNGVFRTNRSFGLTNLGEGNKIFPVHFQGGPPRVLAEASPQTQIGVSGISFTAT